MNSHGFTLPNTDTNSTIFDFLVIFCSFCVYSLVPGVWHVIYFYQVDFSSALRIARKYFWRDSRTEKDIIHLMIKYVHAVKEELRQFSRPLRGIGAVHFAFR